MRRSNLELLRIVSMFYVLTLHVNGIGLGLLLDNGDISIFRVAVESLCIIAVNCFVMISGYFGIKFKITAILSFIVTCLFYSVVISAIFFVFFPAYCDPKTLALSFFPFGYPSWWFITPYIGLLMLAPMVNKFIGALNRKHFIFFLAILTFINLYYGWLWNGDPNPTGYTLSHFIYIYSIGRYISLYPPKIGLKTSFSLYLLFSAVIAAALFIVLSRGWEPLVNKYVLAYNNPVAVLSTISFFIFFTRMNFTSRTVNFLASGVFAVYLIHMHPCMKPVIFPFISELDAAIFPESLLYFLLLAGEIIFMGIVIYTDRVRSLITSPVVDKISNFIERRWSWLTLPS